MINVISTVVLFQFQQFLEIAKQQVLLGRKTHNPVSNK